MLRHGFSRDLADLLPADVTRSLGLLDKHPPTTSMTQPEAGGFSHHARPSVTTVPSVP